VSTNGPATTVRYGSWYDEMELRLAFPQGWTLHRLDPDDADAISDGAVDAAFAHPIGSPRLSQLARAGRNAVVAIDDLSRPTPAHRVLPPLLRELAAGGIPAERVTLLFGMAAHRPMSRDEMEKKVGPAPLAACRVEQHDFLGEGLTDLGWIEGGPVRLARTFVEADLRVCIGGVIPHNETGFGGGSKMIVPGLAGHETIAHFHGALPPRLAGVLGAAPGIVDRRAWSESVARHVGPLATVACVINSRRELAGLHVGDIVEAHRSAALEATAIGRTVVPAQLARECDVAVVNAYPLDTDPIQMGKSLNLTRKLGAKNSVVINAASDGIFYHGMGMGMGIDRYRLLRNFRRWVFDPRAVRTFARSLRAVRAPALAARLGYFTLNPLSYAEFEQQMQPRQTDPVSNKGAEPLVFSRKFPAWGLRQKHPRGRLFDTWEDLALELGRRHPTGRALVFPCAPLQLPVLADDSPR